MPEQDPDAWPWEQAPTRMTDDEMIKAAIDDQDAQPLTETMLARANAQHRLDKSRARRVAAAQSLMDELEAEAKKAE